MAQCQKLFGNQIYMAKWTLIYQNPMVTPKPTLTQSPPKEIEWVSVSTPVLVFKKNTGANLDHGVHISI